LPLAYDPADMRPGIGLIAASGKAVYRNGGGEAVAAEDAAKDGFDACMMERRATNRVLSLSTKKQSTTPSQRPNSSSRVLDDQLRPSPCRTSSTTNPTRRDIPLSSSLMRLRLPRLWTVLALLFVSVAPISAVRVPFDNCLPDDYRFNDPRPLQWVPMYADAVFDTETSQHTLEFVVWGNVNGSRNQGDLPPPRDPYWTDPLQTEGKIDETPNKGVEKPKATTLFRRINIVTFTAKTEAVNFCLDGITNGTCPLAPVFGIEDVQESQLPDLLPSVNLSHDFFSSYAFMSFTPTLLIIYGDDAETNIGCISATLTPDLGGLSKLITFLPLLVLLLTGAAVIYAGIWSPWGSTNVFHWSSNYGRHDNLLRLVTPGFGDCLQYIQFVVLTGSLSLNYPGFYQPIVSQASWSSLIFNQSFVSRSDSWQSVVDGLYVTNGTYGLQRTAQLVGIAKPEDIWAGMMVWLCVITGAVFVLTQLGFLIQRVFMAISSTTEEDLRAKNIPFSIGNVVRIVFNYFLLPLVSLSTFQLVIAGDSPAHTVALAVVTLVVLIVFAAWLLWYIIDTKPKSILFDDLPTVLKFGPLYNTYSDHAAAFALIPVLLTMVRGITIGAVQPSGITQVVLLSICEVIQILTIYAFRPFHPGTSMNIYHFIFSAIRLSTIMLMVAFTSPLGVTDGPKGWIGYVILILHALVLLLGFFLHVLQTVVEVTALILGAGGDDDRGLSRGGLSKIFGMRQLARRVTPREAGPSRASQLSSSAMLDVEDGGKTGYSMPSGRIRSGSAGSLSGALVSPRGRSTSALDSHSAYHRHVDSASSYMPGTPGEVSTFSFITSPTAARSPYPTVPAEAADPYYRPPRRVRRETLTDSIRPESHRESISADPKRLSQGLIPPPGEIAADIGAEISRGPTPAPPGAVNPVSVLPNRPDYSTREVDFYYGVRGPALNSDGPGRKLGTGPADPTGPVATASGWFRGFFGGKTKEKNKGFEVVRSARMPPAMMARNGAFGDETPPEGIPVAMGVLRNGPIDSDDDEPRPKPSPKHKPGDLLTDSGEPQGPDDDDESDSPIAERLPRGGGLAETARAGEPGSSGDGPEIPRKSSKRHSAYVEPYADESSSSTTVTPAPSQKDVNKPIRLSRLPFERSASQRRPSAQSSTEFSIDLMNQPSVRRSREERPASFGMVSQHSISRIDPGPEQSGYAAEVVDEQAAASRRRR
jgi:hypothetical protein